MRHLVPAARAAHARLLLDTCRITRTAKGSFDDSTGKRAEISQVVYFGPCRVKASDVGQREAGERSNVVVAPTLVLPGDDTTEIRERDGVEIISSLSPSLVGRHFAIIGADSATTASARRFLIEGRA